MECASLPSIKRSLCDKLLSWIYILLHRMKEFYDKGTPVHDVRAEHWRADAAEMKQLMYFLL